jgi:hypothetical protein
MFTLFNTTRCAVPAPLPDETQILSPCPLVLPAAWEGSVYPTAAALAAAFTEAGYTYVAATCTVSAPAGTVFPPAPTAVAPTPFAGVALPITFPVVFEGVSYNSLAALDAAIQTSYGVTVTTTTSGVIQTGGLVGLLPASILLEPAPPPATSTLSVCPLAYPVLINGVTVANLTALKAEVEAFYAVTTTYNSATCTFTQVGGAGTLPPTIDVETSCVFTFAGGAVASNGTTNSFRRVAADPLLLPIPGFVEFNDNSGVLVSMLRTTSGTQCGITFNVPVADNSGAVIGYGAQL